MRVLGVVGLLCLSVACAVAQVAGTRYRDIVFLSRQLTSDIPYQTDAAYKLDTYIPPVSDTATNRPLVIFIHGGGFKGNDKVSNYGTRVCDGLSKRGYVVASINYRLTPSIPDDTVHFEAMLRALQDTKAAIRYFRANKALYGIDTSQIFLTGSSAGCITALHAAYLDSAEVPSYVRWGNVGNSFEGTRGTPGYSSAVQGVISCWGAIGDTAWMKPGNVPVYCVHGLTDTTVFYDSIPADGPFLYGSKFIHEAAARNGMTEGLLTFPNTGHTLDNNTTKQDSAIRGFSAWLYTILKPSTTTGVKDHGSMLLPGSPVLKQNYPNPFNPTTTVEYALPSSGHVSINVFDVLGRKVSTLVDGHMLAGVHTTVFNGAALASGIYYCRLEAPAAMESRKMVLMK